MIGRWNLVLLAALGAMSTAGGCFSPNSTTCADGRICPPDSRCDDVGHRCIPTAQELPCVGLPESDACSYANAPGACRRGFCELFFCGNGVVEGTESCDGAPPAGKSCLDYGFDQGLLGCSSTCEPVVDGCGTFPWTVWPTPLTDSLAGVWASGADDVYAAGYQGIHHWNGIDWSTTMPDGHFGGVWGSSPSDVYAVGYTGSDIDEGVIAHWDGSRWSRTTAPFPLLSVWGSGPGDVFAVGSGGAMHWNGADWSRVTDPAVAGTLRESVWGSGANDFFAGGPATIVHWDGSRWSVVLAASEFEFSGLSGTGPDDVFAVGGPGAVMHWDGAVWSRMMVSASPGLASVWAGAPDEVFAVGWDGSMFEWDGSNWVARQVLDANNRPLTTSFNGIFGTGGNVFVVGQTPTLLRWGGSAWSRPLTDSLRSVWAGGPDEAYAVGIHGINHWDGREWASVGPTASGDIALRGVWGSGPDDIVVVGEGVVIRKDGDNWYESTVAAPVPLRSVWGNGRGDVFAVGLSADSGLGSLVHWDGIRWSTLWSDPELSASGVWANGPDEVFIAGSFSGGLYHWDGASMSKVDTGTGQTALVDVWGTRSNDVYAVGEEGTIVHWDGARWTTMTSGTQTRLEAVHGSGAGDVFAGGGGVLLHLRGGTWEPIYVPGFATILGLSVMPTRVFLVGYEGEIHLDRASMTCVAPESDCHDGWDNDCDGLQDGADPDCAGKVAEQCANLVDDDGDGKTDCADPDCVQFPSCKQR